MKNYIHLKISCLALVFFQLIACGQSQQNISTETEVIQKNVDLFQLSKNFYEAVKSNQNAKKYKETLASLSKNNLEEDLKTDTQKKAFWLNIYNSYVQHLLKNNKELYDDRSAFFKEERFTIAGEEMSLDDVEHGMIRDSRVKISMGHLKDPFASKFEKKFRVSKVDWRIHFALNCGAKSCPPVRFYTVENLDKELEASAEKYLKKHIQYKKAENKVFVPKLMDWFRADFDGKDGVIKILKNYELIPENSEPEVEFSDYDWTLDLDNYK